MEPRHARYPFLSGAREAVEAAEVDLAELVAEGGAPVERARERVESAIREGTVGEAVDTRVELLSYPVARVFVSLVDQRALTRRYAHAEATTAAERLGEDLQAAADADDPFADARRRPGREAAGPGVTLAEFLGDFDLGGDVRETEAGYRVRVTRYVALAADIRGERWRLVNRRLADGWVPVTREELRRLLQQAVRERVARDLPLSVPESVADPLAPVVEALRTALGDLDVARDIDTVVPELFPPCMQHLLERVRAGEELDSHSRFAITAFLASIGLSTDGIVEFYGGHGEAVTRQQAARIRSDGAPAQYDPPSCATMQAYGDCVNMDELCERIAHPMAYYERRLEAADDAEDWRARGEER